MKKVFIGHRGVGKTSLLKRHQSYFPDVPHFDLDAEIEKIESKSVSDIFKNQGETKFRQLEKNVFKSIIQHPNFVITLGAGFDSLNLQNDIEVVYVSRRTDSEGRIFLNRPSLNPGLSALAEYDFRFKLREPIFRERADFIYHMPEGLTSPNEAEEKIFNQHIHLKNVFMTLVPEHASLSKKFSHIELRTDLFSDDEIAGIISKDKNIFLISYRRSTEIFKFTKGLIDWPLELGPVPAELQSAELIVSNHDDKLVVAIQRFESYPNSHQKLCPIVTTWGELWLGHKWQSEKPNQRSFLPRTAALDKKSQWRWYRQLQLSNQKINFIQGHQDFDDQPSLFEYLNLKNTKNFAAVMGYPIHHSKTPITQSNNFNLNVLAVPLSEIDSKTAIPILQKLGLVAAAVTSPLKICAGQLCHKQRSINTIVLKNNEWMGASTDEDGLRKLISIVPDHKNKKIIIWGGGGILDSVSEIIPNAVFYSAQTQKPRDKNILITKPDVLIWAAPRKFNIQMPPFDWAPEFVIDLNYTENSLGLEYAQKIKTKYISGDVMFYAQAEKQLRFWKENLKD